MGFEVALTLLKSYSASTLAGLCGFYPNTRIIQPIPELEEKRCVPSRIVSGLNGTDRISPETYYPNHEIVRKYSTN